MNPPPPSWSSQLPPEPPKSNSAPTPHSRSILHTQPEGSCHNDVRPCPSPAQNLPKAPTALREDKDPAVAHKALPIWPHRLSDLTPPLSPSDPPLASSLFLRHSPATGLCTSYALYLADSFPRYLYGPLPHLLPVFAQRSPSQPITWSLPTILA